MSINHEMGVKMKYSDIGGASCTSESVKLYTGRGTAYSNKYYTKGILYKLLEKGKNIVAVYSDDMPNNYADGISVQPSEDIFQNFSINDRVYVCLENAIYAEETKQSLVEAGYVHVYTPNEIGMEKTSEKVRALEFNLNIGCSLNCLYCPQSVLTNSYLSTTMDKRKLHLTFDEFKYIIDERLNPGGTIGFSGMSEPFENDDAVKMILYAYKTGHPVLLNTTLMGLTENKLTALRNGIQEFEKIQLHIPDEEAHSHFNTAGNYKKILIQFLDAYHGDILFYSCHGTPIDEIQDIICRYRIPVCGLDTFSDRAGNLVLENRTVKRKQPMGDHIVCREGVVSQIHAPVVMPDGRLALCCNDYSPTWTIGNILSNSWGDICKGKGWQDFLDGLDKPRSNRCWICATAMERGEAVKNVYPDWYVYGDNFLRVKKALEDGVHIPILDKLRNAKHICIYGLGKFFKDSYAASYWNTILRADVLSDGNPNLYGKEIMGIPVVNKSELSMYEGLLVIIYSRHDASIRDDLEKCGVSNVVNILEIMEALG